MRRVVILAVLAMMSSMAIAKPPVKKPTAAEKKAAAKKAVAEKKAATAKLLSLGVKEIVYAARAHGRDGHWYANFSYFAADKNRKAYGKAGKLCKLDVATGKVTNLVDDPEGTVRDPVVHYNGRRILFSWRKAGMDMFHLYEINADGTGLTQLTKGKYDDFEPCYLPDGGIVFISSRCKRWVNCWLTQVATIHRADREGKKGAFGPLKNIREISANIEQDNTPWVLPDGRLLYQRWEYVDRSQVHYHHLWTMNPDGTGQMVYFGNLHGSGLFIDAKPIPGTDEVLLLNSPGHGRREHAGFVAIVTDKFGPDHKPAMRNITRHANFRDPYPLTKNAFLVARGQELLLMDAKGKTQLLHTATPTMNEPRPLIPRKRETIIPSRVDLTKTTGMLIVNDVYFGRNMKGVKRGEIKKLLVLETLAKPINYTGGMDPLSYGGTFTLERIVGTVPVEEDGSAAMELPANRALFFVALDKNNNSVKRMQSFLTVMPGEHVSCVGCHEERGQTPVGLKPITKLQALQKPPHKPTPLANIPDVFDFPRDIQPILDKHCVRCHGYDKRKGGIILTGDRGPMFSHSYATLTIYHQVADGRNRPKSNYPPRALGTSASKLMKKIDGSHHKVKLSAHEQDMIRYWIESAAAYPGTYASLGSGMIGGYAENRQYNRDHRWPTFKPFAATVKKRCISCHQKTMKLSLPKGLCDEQRVSFWNPTWSDRRLIFSRHLLFNLTRPEKSMMLLAPLSKKAGGLGLCKAAAEKDAPPANVFTSTKDPDYQTMRKHIQAGKAFLEQVGRFDMPHFKPNAGYVREMKRYGILPKDFDVNKDPIDVYETDQKYWKSLWHVPVEK